MNLPSAKSLLIDTLEDIEWGEGISIPVWDDEREEDSTRYIVISNILSTDEFSADDDEQEESHLFFVYCFVMKEYLDELDGWMEKIKTALKSVGFKVSGGHNMKTEDDVNSTYKGRYSEFSIWGV